MIHDTLHQLPLVNLKRKGNKYNFKCPLPNCLDGKTGKKTRAWISQWKGDWWFSCYNCGTSHTYTNFLKYHFPEIYQSVVKKSFKKTPKIELTETLQDSIKTYSEFPLITIDRLEQTHKAYSYINEREIPVEKRALLHYSKNFTTFTNRMTNNRYPDWSFNDERVIIPYRKRDKSVFLFQGRSLEENAYLRYITVKLDEDYPKVFGLERVDFTKKIIVVEGPLDSLFLNNSIAFGGSDLSFDNLNRFFDKQQLIICFDNERRNFQINQKIEKFLKAGYNICLWPKGLKKDVNDMVVKNKLTSEEINNIIKSNVVNGKEGILKHMIWRKR